MTVQNYSQSTFHALMLNGGTHTYVVNAYDIDQVNGDIFETYPTILPRLATGFEIPPTILPDTPEKLLIYQYGDLWSKIVLSVYGKGGKIVYKKTGHQTYDALASV